MQNIKNTANMKDIASSTKKTPLKGILKSPAVSPASSPKNSSGVHFGAPMNLEETLKAAAENNLRSEELDGFITHMKNLQGAALVDWLQQCNSCLTLLKPSLESFVLAIFHIEWADQERPVCTAYKHFITNLISAQSYYTKPVVKMLTLKMRGPKDIDSVTDDVLVAIFDNLHEALRSVIQLSPLAAHSAILSYGKSNMPYYGSYYSKCHTAYLGNLMRIAEYLPNDRQSLITLVIDRLVQLDANLPFGEDLYDEDEEDSDDEQANEDSNQSSTKSNQQKRSLEQVCRDNLDGGMEIMFKYINSQRDKSDEALQDFYHVILKVFESNIMPSYATGHVQYLMFYLCGIKPDLFAPQFCDWLWKQFLSPNTPSIIRQTAVAYIASIIARAKYIPVIHLRTYLKRLTNWIHSYLNARTDCGNDYSYVNVKAHGPFYAACQAVLYMIAFRQDEITQGRKSLDFLLKLGLGRIVTCSLNPLKVCLPPVVKNFAAIARHYQLAYCETVIQRNARLDLPVVGTLSSNTTVIGDAKPCLLDTFFPFDPYRLKSSKHFFIEMYREYQGDGEEEEEDDDSDEEEEVENQVDVLITPPAKRRRLDSSGSLTFAGLDCYVASPGFLKVDFN